MQMVIRLFQAQNPLSHLKSKTNWVKCLSPFLERTNGDPGINGLLALSFHSMTSIMAGLGIRPGAVDGTAGWTTNARTMVMPIKLDHCHCRSSTH